MSTLFHAVECALPYTGATSFGLPLFRRDNESDAFIQSIGADNIIEAFLQIESDNGAIVRMREKITKQVGDPAISCFHFSNGDVVVGSQEQVSDILRDRFKELMRWPFASVEAAKFIGDPGLIRRAIKLAFGKIAKSNLELAIKWRENAVAQSKWVWTPERISELIALWNENLKIKEIGRRLGITEGAVKGKVQRLGLVRQNAVAQSIWTPERIAALIALWNESLSTSEIGRRLGITKNAVTGKVQRLGLVRRRPSPKDEPEAADVVRLETLGANMCSWPVGNPGEANFHFCGELSAPGKPYCAKHCAQLLRSKAANRKYAG